MNRISAYVAPTDHGKRKLLYLLPQESNGIDDLIPVTIFLPNGYSAVDRNGNIEIQAPNGDIITEFGKTGYTGAPVIEHAVNGKVRRKKCVVLDEAEFQKVLAYKYVMPSGKIVWSIYPDLLKDIVPTSCGVYLPSPYHLLQNQDGQILIYEFVWRNCQRELGEKIKDFGKTSRSGAPVLETMSRSGESKRILCYEAIEAVDCFREPTVTVSTIKTPDGLAEIKTIVGPLDTTRLACSPKAEGG